MKYAPFGCIHPDRVLPEGAENPYGAHPGFDSQECPVQYVVHPQTRATSYGFGCRMTGGHCLPGPYCDARRKDYGGTPQ